MDTVSQATDGPRTAGRGELPETASGDAGGSDDQAMEDAAEVREDVVEELVDLVVDQLVPVLGWYRDQLARHLSVGLPGLAVIEDARRAPTTAGRMSLRTAMTPSAITKVIRRLEAQGHVERVPSRTHEQELLVALVPDVERDLVLEFLSARRSGVSSAISSRPWACATSRDDGSRPTRSSRSRRPSGVRPG